MNNEYLKEVQETESSSIDLNIGKALADFVNRVDVTKTRIGEYERSQRGGRQDLIVYGHQMYDAHNVSWLLADIKTVMDCSDKFKGYSSKTPVQLLKEYCEYVEMPSADRNELVDKLTSINSNKMMVVPIKPKSMCNVEFGDDKRKDAQITSIRWVTNKDTHKLECKVIFKTKTDEKVTHDIRDYQDKFRVNGMESRMRVGKHDSTIIKMSRSGIIHPIELCTNDSRLAVDGTYMYYVSKGKIHIVGYWDKQGVMKVTKPVPSELLDRMKDNLEYIKDHKKYIAPYLVFEANSITITNNTTKKKKS
jgi:hypothetical protein